MMSKHLWRAGLFYYVLFLLTSAVNADARPYDNIRNSSSLFVPVAASRLFTNDTQYFRLNTNELVNVPVILLQPSVEDFVTDYLERNGQMLEKIKEKSSSYFSTMDKVFNRQGLPVELKYLAVVESQLKTTATSKVGAAGLWQLMPATAKTLGLKITAKTDERRYAYKSSVAAAQYLDDLYEKFGDWLLVIAAYNGGPGSVYKAIKKSGSRDFWKLQQFLPKETRLHVKKFIATHYYFEEEGSLVTLTKKETREHLEAVEEFLTNQNRNKNPAGGPDPVAQYFNWVAITNDHNKLKVITRK